MRRFYIDELVPIIAIVLLLIALCLMAFAVGGCASFMQGLHDFAADPNASGAAETGVAEAAGVAAFFGPIGAAIAAALGTGLAVWRKVKPSLAAANAKAIQYHAAAASVVEALEAFKTAYPDQWDTLGKLVEAQLTKQNLDPLVIENVIRGLRGLPAKTEC